MDLTYSNEQNLLRANVRKFVQKSYPFEVSRKVEASSDGYSRDAWRQMAEMGLTGLLVPEADGGLGLSPVELLIVMEELGRGLCLEPYVANVVLAGQLIARLGSDAQRAALLPGLLDGTRQVSLAHAELEGRYDLAHCATSAKRDADGWLITGRKPVVLNAPNASELLVLARTSGAVDAASGLSLFVVERNARGVAVKPCRLLGGGVAADVRFDHVHVPASALLGSEGNALLPLSDAIDLALGATSAEALGAMQALLEKTVTYLKTRKQFGQPLAGFQALQHRLSEMFAEIQQSLSVILMASLKLGSADRVERQKAASACKAYLHKASRFVGQQAVQLHGGIGMTEELDIGHYFRRLTAFTVLFGDRDFHLERFAALSQPAAQTGALENAA